MQAILTDCTHTNRESRVYESQKVGIISRLEGVAGRKGIYNTLPIPTFSDTSCQLRSIVLREFQLNIAFSAITQDQFDVIATG